MIEAFNRRTQTGR